MIHFHATQPEIESLTKQVPELELILQALRDHPSIAFEILPAMTDFVAERERSAADN